MVLQWQVRSSNLALRGPGVQTLLQAAGRTGAYTRLQSPQRAYARLLTITQPNSCLKRGAHEIVELRRCFSLTLAAMLSMREEADCILVDGLSKAPISSTRLTRARSLADLASRLACTWGVGARQGATGLERERAGVATGAPAAPAGGQLSARSEEEGGKILGRSVESLLIVVTCPPPSPSTTAWWLLAA